uniref:Uncharacterized protein LOC116306425 isoform X2 n=1 Tax=Actinia tenebrosa TaxID=6105 RepID=A0A6P8J2Q7_ACTTE
MASIVQETTQVVVDGAETEADGYSYKIDLYTGDAFGAGTDANVLLTIYGEDGDSGQRVLDNSGNNFERDSKDHFKIVNKTYLGRIKKITIGHDSAGAAPGWFLNKVTVEDIKSREVFEFPCERWLSTDEDDGLTSRELTWTNMTVKEKEEGETYQYTINIYTGNEWGAGTDANVHVTIYGTKGESGEQKFENKGNETFEGGMKNTYKIETSEPLGTLYKVRVGHDNTGWGPGWFLDKIEAEDDSTGEVVGFACGKWLATDCEDGLIRRDLMREGYVEEVDSPHENVTYTVNILTGNEWGAGTDSNIYFTLYGSAGESEQQTIENEGSTTFECGMTDTYKFDCPYLGTLTKIRIGHDNTGWGPAWYLDKVTVEDSKNEESVVFPCSRWLATNADDGMIERELMREGMFGDNIIIEGLTEGLKGEPLGMESSEIKDENITASSFAENTPPSSARLNNTAGWCAKEAEGSWLQVDLEDLHCVTSIATQGNPGGNQDYVKKYKIEYSQDGDKWTTHEENGNQIFDANVDNTSVKTNDLQKVIVARYIRICPVEWYCWPCLRIEVYGAPLKEGGTEVKTVSYVTEQVVVTTDDKVESVPEDKEEQHKAEDAVKFILSQTGDKRKDIEEQKKQIDDEMKKLEEERKEREKSKEEERKRMEEEEARKEEEEQKKREEEEKRKELEEEERRKKVELEVKKIEEEHQQRLDDLEKKMKEDEDKKKAEIEERKKMDEEELKRVDDEIKKDEEMIKQHEETRARYEEKLKELQSAGIIKTETKTDTIPGDDDGVETVTITRQIIVESSVDDDKKDEGDEELNLKRKKEEKEQEREEKLRRMREEEDKRQQEEKDFNAIMLQMRIKAEGDDAAKKEKEEEEERKKKEEARKIKEREEKQRQEGAEEKKKKEEEKAKRRAEREKKRILLETKKVSSTDSLSSLSSLSSTSSLSSSDEEDDQLASKVETKGFRAPIASVDEYNDDVTKVVTYRTQTTTTTRIVSWPGTHFFKPIEPDARQQTLPEDVGLLFGIENINYHPAMACCDHLKAIDPVVKTAQEISFEEKLSDNKGPLPSWIDKETPLQLYTPINAIGDEDIDKLVEWEKAGTKGWKRTKKTRVFEIWTRKAYEGGPPITKAIITLDDIPYSDAVEIISDWDSRLEWDKTFDKVTVLETIDTSRLVYCPVKKRELFLAIQDRLEEQYYASAWKNTAHPKIDNNKNKKLKLYYLVSGLVIRPISSGGSQITLLCQVKGSVPSQVKSTFLAANPAKWIDALKKHYDSRIKENSAKEE